jgi:hypothetical protein
MENLPQDYILDNMWLYMPYQDIINLCQTHPEFRIICQQNRTWRILLKRDFNIEYNGNNARDMYMKYNEVIDYFSETFPIITNEAVKIIIEKVPKSLWDNIILREQRLRNIEQQYTYILSLGWLSILSDLILDEILSSDPRIQQILQTNCNELLKIATKPTLIFINKKPFIVNYDLDLAFDLNLTVQLNHNMNCFNVVKYIIDYYYTLL